MPPHLLRPPYLLPQDEVILLSPASPPAADRLREGQRRLRSLGLEVRLGRSANSRCGYLAGSDAERRQDFKHALEQPRWHALFCTRGGYGASRLLEGVNSQTLRRHPKILVGFSDITVLHLAFQTAGVVSFWGPMPAATTGLSAFSRLWLQRAVMSLKPLGALPVHPPTARSLQRPGKAQGPLTGGNLTLLAASLGTPYEVGTQGRIVFLEEIGEEPYRIDRMLTQLLAAGKLKDAAGILLGNFRDCRPNRLARRTSLSLREVLGDRLLPLHVPLLSGFPVGHVPDQVTLPYGIQVRMDARSHRVEVLESGVSPR